MFSTVSEQWTYFPPAFQQTADHISIPADLFVDDSAPTKNKGVAPLQRSRNLKKQLPRSVFDKVLATVAMDDAIAEQLNALFDEMYAGKASDAWRGVLVEHVKILADLAARHGTKVVILNYPFRQESVMKCQQAAAESLGAEVALVQDRFAEELKTKERAELFVQDGHCNDGGYALMADVVAPLVVECLKD